MAEAFGSLAPAEGGTQNPYDMTAIIQALMRNQVVPSLGRESPIAPIQMPNVNLGLNSEQFATPKVSADYSTPFFGGNIGMLGSYARNPMNPSMSDWSARAIYRRQF